MDWNDHYRDALRSFWLADRAAIEAGGQGGSVARLADSISGSASLFAESGRSRMASVNLVTAHDGFTLADLVSYDRKHNEANGEQNRDGHGDNRSYNHGFEGPTEDEEILALRAQTSRNLMATLMVSMGIPMITAGDEIGRTQQGNNNAYCQDNHITWLDWTSTPESHAMLRSTKRVIRLRKEFLAGQPHHYPTRDKQAYLHWFDEHGKPMSMDRWNDPQHRVVQLLLGSDDGQVDGLVVVNGSAHDIKITLPDVSNDDGTGKRLFELRLTTSELHDRRQGVRLPPANVTWCSPTPSASTARRPGTWGMHEGDREAPGPGRGPGARGRPGPGPVQYTGEPGQSGYHGGFDGGARPGRRGHRPCRSRRAKHLGPGSRRRVRPSAGGTLDPGPDCPRRAVSVCA